MMLKMSSHVSKSQHSTRFVARESFHQVSQVLVTAAEAVYKTSVVVDLSSRTPAIEVV